ncbi:MAG: acyloxyacyl hydrolase [Burkholderiales bacterium]
MAVFLAGAPIFSDAADSGSLEFATGNFTQMVRIGAQWDWQRQWFENGDSHLGGYWDLTAAEWHGTRYRNILGNVENIADIGITPVFRFQRDGGVGTYFEAAIGPHLLSDLYDNNGRRLSTRFEFGDSLGIGYRFAGGWEAGLKGQHFSNGGIKEPNSGVNFVLVRVSRRFE